jgi:hypothetical protein
MALNNKQTYVLMSGWARSGAALTCSIINSHSEAVFSTDIVKYFTFCYRRYPKLDKNSLIVMLKEMKLRLKARYSISYDLDYCVEEIDDNFDHTNIYIILMNHIVGHDLNHKIIGEYEGVTWGMIPYFLGNIKNSKAMMIVRDPRDVLVSFKKNTIAPGNDYLISVFNSLSLMESWVKYEKLYPSTFYGILFEELKGSTDKIVKGITKFLDIDFESTMLDNNNWKKLHGRGWKVWENHDSSSFSNDNELKYDPVNRWKELIDPVDHFICQWVVGDMMKKFEMDIDPPTPTDELFEAAIKKLTSSPLLRKALIEFIYYKNGAEEFPLDPCMPNNWDKRVIDNVEMLGSHKN